MPTSTESRNWLVQSLRLSLFPALEDKFDLNAEIWPLLKGADQNQKTIDSKTGAVKYEGLFENQTLTLTITSLKIDLLWAVKAPARLEGTEIVLENIGDLDTSLTKFYQLAESWLGDVNIPQIYRLAFGAGLVKPVTSREESYKVLSEYIPFEIQPGVMGDFQLQVNLFEKSQVINNLTLNRLTKWTGLEMIGELGMGSDPKAVKTLSPVNLVSLELDINTDKDSRDKLDKSLLVKLYSELVSLGVKLSKKGIVNNAN